MLACIGESFDYSDEVCGAVFSVRKIFYRISLWTRTSNNKIVETIGYIYILSIYLILYVQYFIPPHSPIIAISNIIYIFSRRQLKATLELNSCLQLEFQPHSESIKTR